MRPYHLSVPLSRNLGTLTSWNPLGHSRPVMGLLYLLWIGNLETEGFEERRRLRDRLCGLVVRVSGYRYSGLGFDSRRY